MNRIRHFSHDSEELTIVWEDASQSQLQAIWLRDHCQMPASRNPDNGQRLLNITDIPQDPCIDRVSLEDGRLVIEFRPDGHRSEFDPDWLYENCYSLNQQHDDRSEINKILWSGDSFQQGLPRYAYDVFCAQRGSRRAALQRSAEAGAPPCRQSATMALCCSTRCPVRMARY
jgi:gamma-butyrobetaine dioxygenase